MSGLDHRKRLGGSRLIRQLGGLIRHPVTGGALRATGTPEFALFASLPAFLGGPFAGWA